MSTPSIFLTAKQARELSEKRSKVNNEGDISHVYQLIEVTAKLGFNKIVTTIFPHMFEYIIASFPNYEIAVVPYADRYYPELMIIMVVW